jgi:hypothetical protein
VFSVVSATTPYGTKRGVATTWLDRLLEPLVAGVATAAEACLRVPVYLRGGGGFRPPSDLSKPLVMVGPGTGVAPFRWRHRNQWDTRGPIWHAEQDINRILISLVWGRAIQVGGVLSTPGLLVVGGLLGSWVLCSGQWASGGGRGARTGWRVVQGLSLLLSQERALACALPRRGFLQHRRAQMREAGPGSPVGESWLFFGCRREEEDYLYGAEWQEFLADGTLSHLDVAFSRAQVCHAELRSGMYAQSLEGSPLRLASETSPRSSRGGLCCWLSPHARRRRRGANAALVTRRRLTGMTGGRVVCAPVAGAKGLRAASHGGARTGAV